MDFAVAAATRSAACAAFSAASESVAVLSCAVKSVTFVFKDAICARRSAPENVAETDLTGTESPVTAEPIDASDATTVIAFVLVKTARVADFEPTTRVVSESASTDVEVTRDLAIEPSENVPPISVTRIDSQPTALPKTSVAETEIDGAVLIADEAGTVTATFDAVPAVPLIKAIVEYAPLTMVTEPTFVLVV